MYGIGKANTPEAFRKACKRFIFVENLLGDGEALREPEEPMRPVPTRSKPEGKVPVDQSRQGTTPSEAPPTAQDNTKTVETVRKQPATKAVPLVIAAMRAHDDDWVPLSVIGSHIRAANPEFDPRTYGCAKLVDLIEKTGAVPGEAQRGAGPGADEAAAIDAWYDVSLRVHCLRGGTTAKQTIRSSGVGGLRIGRDPMLERARRNDRAYTQSRQARNRRPWSPPSTRSETVPSTEGWTDATTRTRAERRDSGFTQ